MKSLLALVLFFGIGSNLFAVDPVKPQDDFLVPKQVLQGAEKTVNKGDLIKLNLSPMTDKIPNLSSYSEEWKVYEMVPNATGVIVPKEKTVDQFDQRDGTHVVIFGAGVEDKTLFVSTAVTYLYMVKEGDKVIRVGTKTVIITSNVVIGNGGNPDPTPPSPNPQPQPPSIPDGKFKLTAFIYNEMQSLTVGKKDIAKAISASYDDVIQQVKDGVISSPQGVLIAANKSATKAVANLTFDKTEYKKLADNVSNQLYNLYNEGKLKTVQDYADALGALSDGLHLIK